jgi:hypothetical protein
VKQVSYRYTDGEGFEDARQTLTDIAEFIHAGFRLISSAVIHHRAINHSAISAVVFCPAQRRAILQLDRFFRLR